MTDKKLHVCGFENLITQEPLSLLLPPNHRCPQHCLQTTAVFSITSKSSMSSVCLHTPDFFSIASKVLISSVLPPNHQRLQYFLKAIILFSIAPKPLMSSLLPLNYRCPQYASKPTRIRDWATLGQHQVNISTCTLNLPR